MKHRKEVHFYKYNQETGFLINTQVKVRMINGCLGLTTLDEPTGSCIQIAKELLAPGLLVDVHVIPRYPDGSVTIFTISFGKFYDQILGNRK